MSTSKSTLVTRKVVISESEPVIEVSKAIELISDAFKLSPDLVKQVLEGGYRKCAWVGQKIGNCQAIAKPKEVFCKRHYSEATTLARDVTIMAANEADVPHIDSFTSENLFQELGKMMGKPLRINHSHFIPAVGVFSVTTAPEGRTIRLVQGDRQAVEALCERTTLVLE
jgi:hypothetical protein